MTTNKRQCACLLVLAATVSTLAGCGNSAKVAKANDELRANELKLNETIDELQDKLALREGELKALREQMDNGAEPVDGVEPPRLAGIVLGRYSGPIDLDGDAKYDALRVYVRPVDQHSRQITAAASARIRLIHIPEFGDPKQLVEKDYDVKAFHAAYRDGITGTHYTLAADLPADRPTKATLHVTLTDAATGRRFAAEKQVVLVRGAAAAD